MKTSKTVIKVKATALIENHSTLATLLAILCLAFAVSYNFFGPGSDGGSGLGGTGKFGGESGLGGTGKTPDSGPSFKLGANDTDESDDLESYKKAVAPEYLDVEATQALLANIESVSFDVTSLRLSPETFPVTLPENRLSNSDMTNLVNAVNLDATLDAGKNPDIHNLLQEEKLAISANALVSSLEILNSLMIAETETSLQLTTATDESDSSVRNRVNLPARPERPDRLSVPTRVSAVQRTAIPAPPPVRPMRTLSSLLNR